MFVTCLRRDCILVNCLVHKLQLNLVIDGAIHTLELVLGPLLVPGVGGLVGVGPVGVGLTVV